MKKKAWIIIGIGALLVGMCCPLSVLIYGGVLLFPQKDAAPIGIIGAADGPTAEYLTATLAKAVVGRWWGIPLIFGAAFLLTGVIGVLFHRSLEKNWSVKTGGLTLALSACGSLGLCCLLNAVSMVAIDDVRKNHPIEYPLTVLLGFLCLLGCLFLIVLYLRNCGERQNYKSLLFDIPLAIVYVFPFLLMFLQIFEQLDGLLTP